MSIIIGVLIIVLLLNIILIGILWGIINDYEEMREIEKKRNEQTEDGRFEDNK